MCEIQIIFVSDVCIQNIISKIKRKLKEITIIKKTIKFIENIFITKSTHSTISVLYFLFYFIKKIYFIDFTLDYYITMSFEKGGFQDIIGIVKKTGDIINNINKKETENSNIFLNSSSTKSFIEYISSKYTPEQLQKELWSSDIINYINHSHKNSRENKVNKIIDITNIISHETKPQLNTLKNTIKNNENIILAKNVIWMVSWENNEWNQLKSLLDEFISLSEEKDRLEFIQSHWISITKQESDTKKNKKEETYLLNTSKSEINIVNRENDNIEIKNELKEKVQNIFEKYSKKNSTVPIEPEKFIKIMNKYWIPLELWLAQAVTESNIWTSWWRPTKTKNIFNVGNVDDWSDKYMKTREDWVENYAKLLKAKYSNNDGIVNTEYLLKNWFRNKNGNKYATDPNYIKKLSTTISSINKIIA